MLMDKCEQEARSLGNKAIALHVEPTNMAAKALYHSAGYQVISKGDGSGWDKLVGRSVQAEGLCLMLKTLSYIA